MLLNLAANMKLRPRKEEYLCLWWNVCHSTAFQEHIGIFQHKINGNPVYGLSFTCENGAGNVFRKSFLVPELPKSRYSFSTGLQVRSVKCSVTYCLSL